MKIAIVTDSTAYLTKEEREKYHITVVPIPVIIDGREYKEGVDLTTEAFYDKLKNSQAFPSTSQPPIGEMIEVYNSLANQVTILSSAFILPALFLILQFTGSNCTNN